MGEAPNLDDTNLKSLEKQLINTVGKANFTTNYVYFRLKRRSRRKKKETWIVEEKTNH